MSNRQYSVHRFGRFTQEQERRLATAKEMYALWIEAEKALTTSKSYTIGTRTLTRENLSEVRKAILYWDNEIAKIENLRAGVGRAWRVVPRDL